MYCTALISRTLTFSLAQVSKTVTGIFLKIVTVPYLVNGIAKGLNYELSNSGQISGLLFATLKTSIRLIEVLLIDFKRSNYFV